MMKDTFSFIKNNIFKGIAIIIPIAVLLYFLWKGIHFIKEFTYPITKNMTFGNPLLDSIILIVLITLILALLFFIVGLFFSTYFGVKFFALAEKNILSKIPFYKTIKGLTNQLVGIENSNYPVVKVDLYGNNTYQYGLLTDTLIDNQYVIYIPSSPMISIGQLHIVTEKDFKIIDLKIKDMIELISKIGFETNRILNKG